MRRLSVRYGCLGTLLTEVSVLPTCIGKEAAGCGRWNDKDITTDGQFLDTSKSSLHRGSDEHDRGGYPKGMTCLRPVNSRLLHRNCTLIIWKLWRKSSNCGHTFEILPHFSQP